MRQLDLFGSLFDDPSPENKREGKSAAVKKDAEVADPAVVHPSYSNNSLKRETPGGRDSIVVTKVEEDENGQQATPIAKTTPLPLSLFDSYAKLKEAEVTVHIDESAVIEVVLNADDLVLVEDIAAPQTMQWEEQRAETEELNNTVEESATDIVIRYEEKAIEVVPIAEAKVEVKKKVTVPKQKQQKLPELQRTGSVIFDDGKITVKLKNRTPFPAPIVKEKTQKPKKEPQKRGRKSFKEIDAEVDLIEIPEDEILFQKQYYPISEVAKWFRVNTSLLRFWENEFDVLKPRKNRKGDRLFRPEDVKNLQLIYQLLRQRKYTIEGAKEYIKTNKKKADIQLQLTTTLQKFKGFLLDLKANLQP